MQLKNTKERGKHANRGCSAPHDAAATLIERIPSKPVTVALAAVLALSGAGYCASALASSTAEAENPSTVSLSHVSIEAADAAEVLAELEVGVPSERVYTVTNTGEDAYVRLASSTIHGDLVHANALGVEELSEPVITPPEGTEAPDEMSQKAYLAENGDGTQDDAASDAVEDDDADGGTTPRWRLADDGFFYRDTALAAGETIIVSVTIEVPFEQAWTDALADGAPSSVTESIDIDAVQARAVELDFEAANPWGDVEADREGAFVFGTATGNDDSTEDEKLDEVEGVEKEVLDDDLEG